MYHNDQFHVRVQLPSFGRVGAARAGVTTITGGVDRDHPTTMVGQPTIVPHAVVDAGAGNLHVGERPGRARNLFRGAVRAEMIDGAEQTFLGRGRGPSHTDVPFVAQPSVGIQFGASRPFRTKKTFRARHGTGDGKCFFRAKISFAAHTA